MSWPSTDFECEIQNELDELRERNELLEKVVSSVRHVRDYHVQTSIGACQCEICKSFLALDLAASARGKATP